ncbi:MAG: hypothetical protein HZY76_00990 [Anaerolineae bacterium]|nr:MAG: hypothetical protein HZY76_00990 [Anaerolineae bacterium]
MTPTATDLPPGQAYVDSVDVLLMESFPVQVRVHIQGNLPDPCSEVTGTQTARSGNAFTIELIVARDSAPMCAQVLKPFRTKCDPGRRRPAGRHVHRSGGGRVDQLYPRRGQRPAHPGAVKNQWPSGRGMRRVNSR